MNDAVVVIDQRTRYEELYRAHGAALWRSVMLFAGDADVANDAVAEAFAQAIRRGDAIESPRAWVTRAAFRIAAGELKERRRGAVLPEDLGYEMPEPVAELAGALARLSPKQRACAVLHFRDSYTAPEIAELIGSTTSAVGVHLHRAKARLRDLLGEEDD